MKIYTVYNNETKTLCYPEKYFDSMKGVTEYLEKCKKDNPHVADSLNIMELDKIRKDGFVYNIIGFDREKQYVRLQLDGYYLNYEELI